VVVAKVDASAHKDIGGRFDVSGFPTLKWFPKGNKAGEAYSGGRTAEDIVNFITENSDAQRVVGGGFLPEAGRDDALDALAEKYMAEPEQREAILAEAEALVASSENPLAKFYTITMKRIASKGDDFPTTEAARLTRMISSGNIKNDKFVQFSKRVNIVNAFVAEE
jgi:protein disulfide-isomerase A6